MHTTMSHAGLMLVSCYVAGQGVRRFCCAMLTVVKMVGVMAAMSYEL